MGWVANGECLEIYAEKFCKTLKLKIFILCSENCVEFFTLFSKHKKACDVICSKKKLLGIFAQIVNRATNFLRSCNSLMFSVPICSRNKEIKLICLIET